MFGIPDTILGATIGAISGLVGLLVGLLINSALEKRKAEREKFKDIRSRLIGERLLSSEVMDFISSLRRKRIRLISWVKLDQKLKDNYSKFHAKILRSILFVIFSSRPFLEPHGIHSSHPI